MNKWATSTFSSGKRWWLAVFVVFIAQFAVFISPPQPVFALTDAEMQDCFNSFNNKDIIRSELTAEDQAKLNKCLGNSCTAAQSSIIGAMRYTCTLAKPSSDFNDATNTANNNETNGLVKLWCNSAPAGEAAQGVYMACASDVRSAYSSCKSTGGSATSSMNAAPEKVASCMKEKLASSKNLINHNIDPAIIAAAVKSGQAATDAATTEAANAETKKKCTDEGGTWKDGTNGAPGVCTPKAADAESKTSCKVDGIGWLVCPVMRFIAMLNDNLYSFIASMLVVNSSLFDTSSQTYAAWDQFKNLANVLFVIAFLVIVYSQITGAGLNNYGIKKLLPKLIIAAILVNVSYWICLIGVELSNIIGYGLKQLFDSFGTSLESTSSGNSWLEVIGIILAGAGAVAAVIGLALAISTPVLIAGFLALAMVAIVLILRQAIVVLLIVVSPIAFVAYLLPNTESWFKKWYKMLFGVLVVFPVISVVFGASALAATVLNSSGDWKMQLVALGASALPLYLVPGLLKGAMAATGSLGAKVGGIADSRFKNVGTQVGKSRLGDLNNYRKQRAEIRRAQVRGGEFKVSRRNPLTWGSAAASKYNAALNKVATPQRLASRYSTTASNIEEKEFEEDVKSAESKLNNMTYNDIAKNAVDTKLSEAEQTAAMRYMMKNGNFDERRELYEKSGELKQQGRSKVLQSMRDGAYGRGDNKIYGSTVGDQLFKGEFGSRVDTDRAIANNISKGKVSSDSITADAGGTKAIADVMQANANGGTYSYKTAPDSEGKQKTVTVSLSSDTMSKMTPEVIDSVSKAASDAPNLEHTKSKITGEMSPHIQRISQMSSGGPKMNIPISNSSSSSGGNSSGFNKPTNSSTGSVGGPL